jgi:hypothetical protein
MFLNPICHEEVDAHPNLFSLLFQTLTTSSSWRSSACPLPDLSIATLTTNMSSLPYVSTSVQVFTPPGPAPFLQDQPSSSLSGSSSKSFAFPSISPNLPTFTPSPEPSYIAPPLIASASSVAPHPSASVFPLQDQPPSFLMPGKAPFHLPFPNARSCYFCGDASRSSSSYEKIYLGGFGSLGWFEKDKRACDGCRAVLTGEIERAKASGEKDDHTCMHRGTDKELRMGKAKRMERVVAV